MSSNKIDFLGIGAQKAGTTWLWNILKSHPDVWMPPKKELHYFSRDPKYPSWSYLFDENLLNRFFGQESYNKAFRKLFKRDLSNAVRSSDWKRIDWLFRYYLGTYNDSLYLSLFKDGDAFLKGEITPDYSILNMQDIQKIKELLPDLKIILLLRNPINRAWSQARFAYTHERFSDIDNSQQIINFLKSRKVVMRGDYVKMVSLWNSVFGKHQLFVGFYEEIISSPQMLIREICEFLNLDISKLPYLDLKERKKYFYLKRHA